VNTEVRLSQVWKTKTANGKMILAATIPEIRGGTDKGE
jgi:hypothetical protein